MNLLLHPSGAPTQRRAIQLGLRGATLARYARDWIVQIEDISGFVAEQRRHVSNHAYHQLVTPREAIYPVSDADIAARLGISAPGDASS